VNFFEQFLKTFFIIIFVFFYKNFDFTIIASCGLCCLQRLHWLLKVWSISCWNYQRYKRLNIFFNAVISSTYVIRNRITLLFWILCLYDDRLTNQIVLIFYFRTTNFYLTSWQWFYTIYTCCWLWSFHLYTVYICYRDWFF